MQSIALCEIISHARSLESLEIAEGAEKDLLAMDTHGHTWTKNFIHARLGMYKIPDA